MFTLEGHLDRIRTVQFHQKYLWIVSASDDRTVRIWNWESRACYSVLSGHTHSVMSASFHPQNNNLLLSASLDKTIRVWDICAINRNRKAGVRHVFHVKYVLEGHDRAVNWAAFSPIRKGDDTIVSGSDDGQIKY